MFQFDVLAETRKVLREFCRDHYTSVESFRCGLSFRLNPTEGRFDEEQVRHITSSITCYSSLLSCPEATKKSFDYTTRDGNVVQLDLFRSSQMFADKLLALPPARWKSDDSARIYCECRSLPFAITKSSKWHKNIAVHIKSIMNQLKEDPDRLAIGEADSKVGLSEWYPPNAYHTYWFLESLSALEKTYATQHAALATKYQVERRSAEMRQWARGIVGVQVALHDAKSSTLDTDQLAWALAILCRHPQVSQAQLDEQDFLRAAFQALFSTQTNVGTWRHYAPLFHYKRSGNAYCFIFETFSVLLEAALMPGAVFLRSVLRDHYDGLVLLHDYAKLTVQNVPDHPREKRWSSGHRLNKSDPESWATASVFSFIETLRRLVGVWTKESARADLPRVTSPITRQEALTDLVKRSSSWTLGEGLSDRLITLFVNPQLEGQTSQYLDPDAQPIRPDSARSAILYGPPGASKTTIVRSLAAAIGWNYVELHSSHFVADGLPNVQKTADSIFRRLYELDHTVVLLDEIDELVREREKEGEASGRFLTTSMLPKLAELWEGRKVIYFVATNHIDFFDRAITRAQRFDAVWFVSPPSFQVKCDRIKELISQLTGKDVRIAFTKVEVETAMPKPTSDAPDAQKRQDVDPAILAKFMLLRWDELDELALRISVRFDGSDVTKEVLGEGLAGVRDGKWRTLKEYVNFIGDQTYQRRDYGKLNWWEIDGESDPCEEITACVREVGGKKFLCVAADTVEEIVMPNFEVTRVEIGRIRLKKKSLS